MSLLVVISSKLNVVVKCLVVVGEGIHVKDVQ